MYHLKLLCAAALAAMVSVLPAQAQEPEHHHALSLVGKIKYPPNFPHFDYVNPKAPKGGVVRQAARGSFDTLNLISMKGSLAGGLQPIGPGLQYDTLLLTSLDESSTEYGLLAEWVSYPADYSSATFKLRDGARWHDGTPITPEDVIFSLEILKKGNPVHAQYYHNVERAEKTGDGQVTFTFNVKNNRELPLIIGQFPVQPKHYWTGKAADGTPRDPLKTTLEPPLGSGPYRIKEVKPGHSIVYERVPDYWGKDLPVRVGTGNFDEIRLEYFRDDSVAFEAFKAGQVDFRTENSAKNWATGYDFPAKQQGHVVLNGNISLKNPHPMQAFVMNIRRAKLSDARVRQAFNLALDFEWTNQNIFYGQYKRTGSYFENTEMAAQGLPQGLELQILEEVRAQVPPQVFTEEYKNPVNATPEALRDHLRQASQLLTAAGWAVKDGVLKNAAGETLEVEFLITQENLGRIILPYTKNLQRLGIKSNVRLVDDAQYEKRVQNFDYDIIIGGFAQSKSPGNEQREFWSSKAADTPGSRNAIGIKNPAVDKLVERIVFAKDREELVAACRALDRVLLWNHYVVPQWYSPNERIAYWDKFAHPQTLPARSVGFPTIWWFDAEKAAKLPANK